MRRMRTINEAVAYFKEQDPETAITANCIRKICKEGKIHCVQVGNRYLLDLDEIVGLFFG